MTRVIISGCNGRMGQVVTRMCAQRADMEVVAGFDLHTEKISGYPVYADPMEYAGGADVIIDFSNPASLDALLDYALRRHIPLVVCTTGHSPAQLEQLRAAAKQIPVFKSGNMSVGINLLMGLVKKAAAVLGDSFDVEVVYERQSVRQPRGRTEIGISAVRGGTIVGEHEVIFAGTDEVVEFRHTAHSREVFANGAVTAAAWITGVTAPGMYDMRDALAEVLER